MEQLITASIGIIECKKKFYLQIITAEKYKFYHVPISIGSAVGTSEMEGLEITKMTQLPKGILLIPPSFNH